MADGDPETEVTAAMIEAGEAVIFERREEVMASTLAEEVYLAMERAKRCPGPK